jgi:glycosyltransferase involved in cell wall biosynthesis
MAPVSSSFFNGNNTIEDCLKSFLGQPYKDVEHIIIDGVSTDGTLDVIRRYMLMNLEKDESCQR